MRDMRRSAQTAGQRPEPRQLKALALPGLDRENNPEEEHGQRSQNSGKQERHGRGNIRNQQSDQRKDQENGPDQNALPRVKAEKSIASKPAEQQQSCRRYEREIGENGQGTLGGGNRAHGPSAGGAKCGTGREISGAVGTPALGMSRTSPDRRRI